MPVHQVPQRIAACAQRSATEGAQRQGQTLTRRCVLMKDHSASSFWCSGTSMTACCSFSGVGAPASACTARYSGSRRLSRARSRTCRTGTKSHTTAFFCKAAPASARTVRYAASRRRAMPARAPETKFAVPASAT